MSGKGRMKLEPIVLMVALVLVGIALVWMQPPARPGVSPRDGAVVHRATIGQARTFVEVHGEPGQETFRVLGMEGHASEVIELTEFEAMFGSRVVREIRGERNAVFRIFNITTYASLVWIAIGLGGQIVFSCRFLIQWIVSERKRESVIPDIFWWISLLGGVCLFVYFVWRRDIVGVLGQSTGIVIYARNIRLIHKKRRRELRNAANGVLTDPASEEANAP